MFEDWFQKLIQTPVSSIDLLHFPPLIDARNFFLPCSLPKLGSVDGRQGLADTQISGRLEYFSHQKGKFRTIYLNCNKLGLVY